MKLFADGYLKRKLYIGLALMTVGTIVNTCDTFGSLKQPIEENVATAQTYNRPSHSNRYFEYDEPWVGYVCTNDGHGVYVRTEPYQSARKLNAGAVEHDDVIVFGQAGAWLYTATPAYTYNGYRTNQMKTGWIKSDYVCEY